MERGYKPGRDSKGGKKRGRSPSAEDSDTNDGTNYKRSSKKDRSRLVYSVQMYTKITFGNLY